MKSSTEKILTTHTGSLPWASPLTGSEADFDLRLKRAVGEVVERQGQTGSEVGNEGEYTKGGDWLSFMDGRIGGCEIQPNPESGSSV